MTKLQGWASVLFKRTFRSLCSFPFFAKERFVLYVHFRSLQKNVTFSTFISVLCKRTFHSLRSFFVCKKNISFIFRTFSSIFIFLSFLGVKCGQKNSKMNGKERFVQKMNGKERDVQNVKERSAQPCKTPKKCETRI